MDVLKIQSQIEEHIKELKRIAKENNVNISVYASPYIFSKDTTSITKVEMSGDKDIEEILHQEESDEMNMVFKYRKLTFKEEKTA
jgi:metal-dependent hydrolase (beta-lactamase superfamily II)